MSRVSEWKIQLAWGGFGVLAGGASWYFFSLNQYLVGSVSMILALGLAALAIHLHKKADAASNSAPDSTPPPTPAEEFVQRYLDEPAEIRFVKTLPKLRLVIYGMCREGWDTGNSCEMRKASYELIGFLESSWVRLAEFYPEKHFGNEHAKAYIHQFIRDRFTFHWAKHEPGGPGTGGTIVGVMVGADVIADFEAMISDTVTALFLSTEGFNLKNWQKEWRRKP